MEQDRCKGQGDQGTAGERVKGKVKTAFGITSAPAKASRKLPSAHPASLGGGQEQDVSFFRSRPPGETRGKLG